MPNLGKSFKALADGTRRRILELLKDGDLNAGSIADHFKMSKPSISHHLGILKDASLVTERREGQNIIYTLVPENIHECWIGYLAKLMIKCEPAAPKTPAPVDPNAKTV
ncbi:MAG: winged helix-turn-helix transcriptional regulator [Planctomycetes bacterium]|nr:winged helix-turn-helix transcriptional regulator [Planctomycetota bacterium]